MESFLILLTCIDSIVINNNLIFDINLLFNPIREKNKLGPGSPKKKLMFGTLEIYFLCSRTLLLSSIVFITIPFIITLLGHDHSSLDSKIVIKS